MKKRKESDASLWIGLVLGTVVGAAATVILAAASEPDTNFPKLNLRPHASSTNAGISTSPSAGTDVSDTINARVEQASKSLKENDEERTEGAADSAG